MTKVSAKTEIKLNQDSNPVINTNYSIAQALENIPVLTEKQSIEAFEEFVSQHCCYGKEPLKNITLTSLERSFVLKYELETYTETRSFEKLFEPYGGFSFSNQGMGAFNMWDVSITPKILFNNEKIVIEAPDTSHIKDCFFCFGKGEKNCESCSGRGYNKCTMCDHGKRIDLNGNKVICINCNGSTRKSCEKYNCVSGKIKCSTCKGRRTLRWFIELTVQFMNYKNDFFNKKTEIPDDLLRECIGHSVYFEQNTEVKPIINFSDNSICQASLNLLNSHSDRFKESKILAQRQSICVLPINLCSYIWQNKKNTFKVFGLDNRVYAPNYPQKCFCSII